MSNNRGQQAYSQKNRQFNQTKKSKESISIAVTVEEFYQMKLQQIGSFLQNELKWATARIFFYIYISLGLLSLGLFGLFTMPILSFYFFGTWKFWINIKYYPKLLLQGYNVLFLYLKDRSYKYMFQVPLTEQPLKSPDRNVVRVSGNWVHEDNTCFGCVRCCEKINCPLLMKKEGMCAGYNSFYWRYFLCGRYPFTQQQIDFYQCTKWEMKYMDEPN